MSLTKSLENLAKAFLPPSGARLAKRMSVGTRYRSQLAACKRGYSEFGDRYPQKTLFVAGLPKSGTTWLEKMLGSYEGFHELMIPEVARHEMETGGSHDYELPEDMFGRFEKALVLSKMHVHGSEHNASLLKRAGVRYVVLYRDLRDVAVSNFFYVRNTPWHPEHAWYKGIGIGEGLRVFASRTLPAYERWVRSWQKNHDSENSVIIQYEELLDDAAGVLARVAGLFELDDSDETVQRIVRANSFGAMSGGRSSGESNENAFARKGVAGDWVNHFDEETRSMYKESIGQFLIDFGYERSLEW